MVPEPPDGGSRHAREPKPTIMHEVYSVLPTVLNPQKTRVVVEVGSHAGADTLRLMRLFPQARLFCFEPDPRNVAMLRMMDLPGRVTVLDAAISDRDGTAPFYLSSGNPAHARGRALGEWTCSSSLKAPREHLEVFPWCRFDAQTDVPTLKLDSAADRLSLSEIDFIWADVQGAEDLMLAGGQQALARTRYLFTEFSDRPMYEGQIGLEQIIDRLPGTWKVVRRYAGDALLRNTAFDAVRLAA